MSKFREEFRIETSRLPGFDYSLDGSYYITICTRNKTHYLGEIESGNIVLSECGIVADRFWNEIPRHYPTAILDEYTIMPDHIHGIIIINNKFQECVETRKFRVSTATTIMASVETGKLPVSTNVANSSDMPHMKPGSISSIINQFKRICTITIRNKGIDFGWQPRFYDHIIRSIDELNSIRDYIKNNPQNWMDERLPSYRKL